MVSDTEYRSLSIAEDDDGIIDPSVFEDEDDEVEVEEEGEDGLPVKRKDDDDEEDDAFGAEDSRTSDRWL